MATWDQLEIIEEINKELNEEIRSRLFRQLSQIGESGAELLITLRKREREIK